MDLATAVTISGECETASRWIRERCAVIFDREQCEFSSGVWIGIGDHVFVATAGHAIPASPNRRLWLMRKDGSFEHQGFPSFLKYGKIETSELDVGFLELSRETFGAYFGQQPLVRVDQIENAGIGRKSRLHGIVGCPVVDVKQVTNVENVDGRPAFVNNFRVSVITLQCTPLSDEDWPTHWIGGYQPNQGHDLVFEYPKGNETVDPRFELKPAELPSPKGMSGGGIWDYGLRHEEIWSPNDCRLVGLQHSRDPDQDLIRGTQIRHWLNLIVEHYPMLKDEVLHLL